jgi:hypothetical protein
MDRKTSNANEPDIFVNPGFLVNFQLLFGCPRRSRENRFRKEWVQSNIARRTGQCHRCGACCRMGFRCPSLKYDADGQALCEIYDKRTNASCRDFPMSERDLTERDKVCTRPCGFSFADAD